MKFFPALWWYIFFLTLGVCCLLILMPTELSIGYGKNAVCGTLKPIQSACESIYPVPNDTTIQVKRPEFHLELLGGDLARDLEFRYGLDIKGGVEVVLSADMTDIKEEDRATAHESAREVIARRVDLYGLSESSVLLAKSDDDYRLIVELPGSNEGGEVQALIGSTAQLEFREYKPSTASALLAARQASDSATPSGLLIQDFVPTTLKGNALKRTNVRINPQTNQPVIELQFTPEGTTEFAKLTRANIGKPLAIFMDNYPLSAPTVQNEIVDGLAQISGDFDLEQAKSLSIALNAGALPVPVRVLSQQTVGPSLGEDQVRRSVQAGIIGILCVVIFLIALYGVKGVLAAGSLFFFTLFSLALYKLIPITLTLPGIAGFILSVGMAVDTNILVFERLREEEQLGHSSTQKLLAKSFQRAFNSIKDANILTLLTAFLLANPFSWSFLHTSGMVRGFAFTLALGIVLNLCTGMILTRVLLSLFYRPKNTV